MARGAEKPPPLTNATRARRSGQDHPYREPKIHGTPERKWQEGRFIAMSSANVKYLQVGHVGLASRILDPAGDPVRRRNAALQRA